MNTLEIVLTVAGSILIPMLIAGVSLFSQSRKNAREQGASLARIEGGITGLQTDVAEVKVSVSDLSRRTGALEVVTGVHQAQLAFLVPHMQFGSGAPVITPVINNNPPAPAGGTP